MANVIKKTDDVTVFVQGDGATNRAPTHEAMKRGGAAGEIAFRVLEEAPGLWKSLKAPLRRLAAKNLPLAGRPDWNLTPSTDSIVAPVKNMVK